MSQSDADLPLAELYLTDLRIRMRGLKTLGEGALRQLGDNDWHIALVEEGNSAAVLVQHLSGNMHSRWAALRSGYREGQDGESAGRNRDAEFEERTLSAPELWTLWNAGWAAFLDAVDHLSPTDLMRPLTIRGEAHTVLEACQRQVAHYSGHVYQLIFLTKTLCGAGWQTLSVARGQSAAFNAAMFSKEERQKPT
ncbi:DUF1572 family protein [Deinococcus detaillensis]|uniref:DUF1572 family protein n=1 Tax=Deinococcus detaillensis TaxID=2592048 RepID=UPI001CDD63D0|nr:DUF1572 family protein [Deinococcus detaillensis]